MKYKKHLLLKFIVFISLLLCMACAGTKMKEHESGLMYKSFICNENNQLAKVGDILVLDLKYYTTNDSLIFDSKEFGHVFRQKLNSPSHIGGSIEDAYALLHLGDSIKCRVDAKSFYRKTKKMVPPSFVKYGDKLVFYVKLKKIQTFEEFEKEKSGLDVSKKIQEKRRLKKYLQLTNTEIEPTENGLYYINLIEGTGGTPVFGDMVVVDYLGSYLDGKLIGTSYNKNPVKFRLGDEDIIQGWNEGVSMMRKGGRAKLIIPSSLAYGGESYQNIPSYSTLIFEIDLLGVNP